MRRPPLARTGVDKQELAQGRWDARTAGPRHGRSQVHVGVGREFQGIIDRQYAAPSRTVACVQSGAANADGSVESLMSQSTRKSLQMSRPWQVYAICAG